MMPSASTEEGWEGGGGGEEGGKEEGWGEKGGGKEKGWEEKAEGENERERKVVVSSLSFVFNYKVILAWTFQREPETIECQTWHGNREFSKIW